MNSIKPRFYFNSGKEDRIAFKLVRKAGIPHIKMGPTSYEPTPFIEYGYWKFSGIQGIQEFIERWIKEELPSLHLIK